MRAPQTIAFDEFDFLAHARFRFDSYFRTKRLYEMGQALGGGLGGNPINLSSLSSLPSTPVSQNGPMDRRPAASLQKQPISRESDITNLNPNISGALDALDSREKKVVEGNVEKSGISEGTIWKIVGAVLVSNLVQTYIQFAFK